MSTAQRLFEGVYLGKDHSFYTFRSCGEEDITAVRTELEQRYGMGRVTGPVLIRSHCLLGSRSCGHTNHPPNILGFWVRKDEQTEQRVGLIEVGVNEQLPLLFNRDPLGRTIHGKPVWRAANGQVALEHCDVLIGQEEYERRLRAQLPPSGLSEGIAEHGLMPIVDSGPTWSSPAAVRRTLDTLLDLQSALADPAVSHVLFSQYGVNVALLRQALDMPANPEEKMAPPPLPWYRALYTKVANFFGAHPEPTTHPAFATGETVK